MREWSIGLGLTIVATGCVGLWFVPAGDTLDVGLCLWGTIVGSVMVLVGCAPRHLT